MTRYDQIRMKAQELRAQHRHALRPTRYEEAVRAFAASRQRPVTPLQMEA